MPPVRHWAAENFSRMYMAKPAKMMQKVLYGSFKDHMATNFPQFKIPPQPNWGADLIALGFLHSTTSKLKKRAGGTYFQLTGDVAKT